MRVPGQRRIAVEDEPLSASFSGTNRPFVSSHVRGGRSHRLNFAEKETEPPEIEATAEQSVLTSSWARLSWRGCSLHFRCFRCVQNHRRLEWALLWEAEWTPCKAPGP